MKDTLDAISDALGYIHYNKAWIKNNNKLRIENVIFNGPATIVFWSDKTKTVIKCSNEEGIFDEEKGLAMAIIKKIWEVSGMEGSYYRQIFKKWIKEEEPLSPSLVEEFFKKATECFAKMTDMTSDEEKIKHLEFSIAALNRDYNIECDRNNELRKRIAELEEKLKEKEND